MACRHIRTGMFACIVMTVLTGWNAEGAIFRRMSLDSLVQCSEYVIYGRIMETRAQWDPATATIWTRTEVLVIDGPKGQPGQSVAITEPGGILNGRGVLYPGTPQFKPGQEVVLFLYRAPGNRLRVTGLLQGVYAVVGDRLTGERMAQPVLPQPEAAYEDGSPGSQTVRGLPASQDHLSHFLYVIRQKAAKR